MTGILSFLQNRHIPFDRLLHCPAPSAERRAHSVHVPGQHVAKAVLVGVGSGYALAVLPATHWINLDRLQEVLGSSQIRIASEDEVATVFFDCELGALPPFGRLYGLSTLVDVSLSNGVEIVFEGNARHESVRIKYRDFEILESPVRARFAEPISRSRRLPSTDL